MIERMCECLNRGLWPRFSIRQNCQKKLSGLVGPAMTAHGSLDLISKKSES
jgi:hypothetical protein